MLYQKKRLEGKRTRDDILQESANKHVAVCRVSRYTEECLSRKHIYCVYPAVDYRSRCALSRVARWVEYKIRSIVGMGLDVSQL